MTRETTYRVVHYVIQSLLILFTAQVVISLEKII